MTPSQRLADLRPALRTRDELRAALRDLAGHRLRIEALTAKTNAELDAIKAQFDRVIAPDREACTRLEAEIAGYITAHPDQFKRPRKLVTEHGECGLRTVTDVVADDAEAAIQHCLEAGYGDCVATRHALVKPGLKARLEAGERIPGVHIRTGDTVVCQVSKTLIAQAREGQHIEVPA